MVRGRFPQALQRPIDTPPRFTMVRAWPRSLGGSVLTPTQEKSAPRRSRALTIARLTSARYRRPHLCFADLTAAFLRKSASALVCSLMRSSALSLIPFASLPIWRRMKILAPGRVRQLGCIRSSKSGAASDGFCDIAKIASRAPFGNAPKGVPAADLPSQFYDLVEMDACLGLSRNPRTNPALSRRPCRMHYQEMPAIQMTGFRSRNSGGGAPAPDTKGLLTGTTGSICKVRPVKLLGDIH